MEKPTDSIDDGKIKARWGSALQEGFVVVPRALLNRQAELGLEPADMVVLMNLLASWWEDGSAPYLAVRTLASRMGVSVRTAQRALQRLESRGFLSRQRLSRGTARSTAAVVTRYDLSQVVTRVQAAAQVPVKKVGAPAPSGFNAGRRVPSHLMDQALEGFKEVA